LATSHDENKLHITALRNTESISRLRSRAEQELREATETLRRENQELQRQQELLQITLASIGDGVITADGRGLITSLNPVAETVTGWTSSEGVGKPLSTVFHVVDKFTREVVEHPIVGVLTEGQATTFDDHISVISRLGAQTPIEQSTTVIRDLSGNVSGTVTVFRDVTARLRAELALSESGVRFRTLFNQGAVGVAVTDLAGRFQQVNQKFSDMFGYSSDELHQCTFLQLTHPGDQTYALSALHRLATQDVSDIVLEKRCVHKNGNIVWSLSTITLVKDPAGRPQSLIGIVEDITHLKQAEEAQGRLAAVVASSEDSIISMTLDGLVLTWNQGAERMYGYPADEMIGSTTIMLVPLDRFGEGSALCERIRKGERIEHFETIRERKDGTVFNASIAMSPIVDMRGKVVGASEITRDVTHSKRAETALEETSRQKDDLLSMLTHELSDPPAQMRQAAIISKRDGATEAQKRWSDDVINRQVRRISSLLDDLLDISRIVRGTLKLRPEMTRLATVVQAAVEAAHPVIDAKRHVLTIVTNDQHAQILADPLRLAQILSALLTNAATYMNPEGQIQLRIECTPKSISIAVKDSGIGLPVDAMSSVFEIFSRLKSTEDKSEGGAGIGLALAKDLVELHGGQISAKSAGLGHGSEFTVQLPRK
jgi:two-component system, chemotaxis family, CheB/CheR fusion protein